MVTYCYPSAVKYITSFLQSLERQNSIDFDLFVFNDSVENLESYFLETSIRTFIFDVSGTPQQIRFDSISVIRNSSYTNVIFQDVDDTMSSNRLSVTAELLTENPIVVCNLSITDEFGVVTTPNIWASRIEDGITFGASFIRDYNLVGFGNTGIRKELLESEVKFESEHIAADWFLFYQIMHNTLSKAIFTSDCCVYYRQHDNSLAGFQYVDLAKIFQVKERHYRGLCNVGFDFTFELNAMAHLDKSKVLIKKNAFWWETHIN